MSGASRWLDAPAPLGPRPATPAAKASPSAASAVPRRRVLVERIVPPSVGLCWLGFGLAPSADGGGSGEHTAGLQSRLQLLCRLLLAKKKTRRSRLPGHAGHHPIRHPDPVLRPRVACS